MKIEVNGTRRELRSLTQTSIERFFLACVEICECTFLRSDSARLIANCTVHNRHRLSRARAAEIARELWPVVCSILAVVSQVYIIQHRFYFFGWCRPGGRDLGRKGQIIESPTFRSKGVHKRHDRWMSIGLLSCDKFHIFPLTTPVSISAFHQNLMSVGLEASDYYSINMQVHLIVRPEPPSLVKRQSHKRKISR